jgi:hypothetical protein
VAARHQPVEQGTEREQIGPPVERLHLQRFGRHERRSAHDMLEHTHRGHGTEVDQLGATLAGAADVARRDVAVQETPRVEDGQ